MDGPLQIDIVTVFPDMLSGFLESSMLKRATKLGAARFNLVNLRDFAEGARRTTDDRPYGGGPGMVMLADPIVKAVESLAGTETKRVMMTPSGKRFDQCDAHRLSQERHLVFVCGHYEGIDDRVRQILQPEELSIGDYVLTNGVLPAAVVIDAVVRLLPGVLGGEGATVDESFETGLLDFPQFTRPVEYRGLRVPEVLQSGNHAAIAAWRCPATGARARRPRRRGRRRRHRQREIRLAGRCRSLSHGERPGRRLPAVDDARCKRHARGA